MKVFFTYVWGGPGDPAWPLTFSTKQARRHALENLEDGDLVFTVGTKSEPTPEPFRGKVAAAYRVSDLEVSTQDYNLPTTERTTDKTGKLKFPFALHPLEVWKITDNENRFSELVGSLTPTSHLQAQSRLFELDDENADILLNLKKSLLTPAEPSTEFGKGRVQQKKSKLAPKHEGEFSGKFGEHDLWYVYTLLLNDAKNKTKAIKLGYSHDPIQRKDSYNKSIATEVTGFSWVVDVMQPTASEDAARNIEQSILSKFETNILQSNGEILVDVDKVSLAVEIALLMRERE